MSFLVRASSLFVLASLAGCSFLFDFPEEGSIGGQGGEPHGANNPSGPGGGPEVGGGGGGTGGGPEGGGGGTGGSPPTCQFDPEFDWSFTLGTVDIDIRAKLAEGYDSDGDLWVAGHMLGGELQIAGNTVTSSGDGQNDIYLIEIDPTGDLKRGFVFGGTGWAYVYELSIAPDGRIALAGSFAGDMTFPGGITITAAPQIDLSMPPTFDERDAWVALFDPASETFPYAKGYGGGDGVYEEATSAKFLSNGDLIVSASVEAGVLDWGGGATLIDGVSVARLDGTLGEVWKRQLDTNIALPGHVAVLPDDSFVVAATTYENNVFGMTQQGEVSYGGPDAFVAHYDADGDWLWHRIFGDDNEQTSTNVAVGPSGDVYLVGTFKQGLKEHGLDVIYSGAETEYFTEDVFFARLDTENDGATSWVQRIYGIGYAEAQDITIGCGERVYITGDVADTGSAGLDFGDGINVPTASSDTYEDLFYATYDGENAGTLLTKERVGDDWIELSRGLLLDPNGGFVLLGTFYESIFFDSALGGLLQNNERSDIFVVRYGGTQ